MHSPHLVWQVTLTLLLTAFVQALTTVLLIACLHIASADSRETSGVALAHYELRAYMYVWLAVIVASLAASAVFVWRLTAWLRGARAKTYAEPVGPGDLRVGTTYCSVQFLDTEMLIPTVEPLVFIGRDLMPDDYATLYCQPAEPYRDSARFESDWPERSVLYVQGEDEIKHIFEYERALECLSVCSLRRSKGGNEVRAHHARGGVHRVTSNSVVHD